MAVPKNSGLNFDNNQVKDDIKKRFDMLGYAQRRFASVSKAGKDNFRIDGYQGLTFNPSKGAFYRHSTKDGGDVLDFIGWCLFQDAWDKRDPGMFKTVLEEGAKELGISSASQRPKSTVVAPNMRIVDPGLTWHYSVKGKNGEATTLTAIFNYPNGNQKGRFEFINSRTQKPDKVFQWRYSWQPVEGGKTSWEKGSNGEPGLYNIQTALDYDIETPILIVESEKEVDLLAKLDIPAVCNAFGAGPAKWPANNNPLFTGRTIILSPDKIDEDHPKDPGPAYFKEILDNIYPVAKTIKLLDIDAHDITKWLNSGHDFDELRAKIASAPLASIEGILGKPPETNKPKIVTAKELMTMKFEAPKWVIPDLLAEGASLIVGRPKSGKGYFMLDAAIAIAAGGVALGSRKVEQGDVLYLSLEDDLPELQLRLQQLCPDGPPDGLEIVTEWPKVHEGGLELLEGWLKDHPKARMILIDTLEMWRKPASGKENVYRADYEALRGTRELAAKHRVAIPIIHHVRKGQSEEAMEDISGSYGLSAAVHSVIIIRRKSGDASATIHVSGKRIEKTLAAKFEYPFWTLEGDASDFNLSEERRKILTLLKLPEFIDLGLQPVEIAKELNKNRATTRSLLADMLRDNQLFKDSKGRYYIPSEDGTFAGNKTNSTNTPNSGNRATDEEIEGVEPDIWNQ